MNRLQVEAARERFRECVRQIALDPAAFQRSPGWAAFEADLRAHLIPALVANARSDIGWSFEPDELPTMIMFMFIDRPTKLGALERSDDPFGHAYTMFREWRWRETDRGTFRYENLDNRTGFAAVTSINTPSLHALAAACSDPLDLLIEQESSRRSIAVTRTVDTIELRTPADLREVLPRIVWWMSDQKLDEAGRRDAGLVRDAGSEFDGVDAKHLGGIARAVWGFRPNRSQSSLLMAFLRDPEFDPFASSPHFWALRQYRALMAA